MWDSADSSTAEPERILLLGRRVDFVELSCLCSKPSASFVSPELASLDATNVPAVRRVCCRVCAFSRQGWAATVRRGFVTGDMCRRHRVMRAGWNVCSIFWQCVCFSVAVVGEEHLSGHRRGSCCIARRRSSASLHVFCVQLQLERGATTPSFSKHPTKGNAWIEIDGRDEQQRQDVARKVIPEGTFQALTEERYQF